MDDMFLPDGVERPRTQQLVVVPVPLPPPIIHRLSTFSEHAGVPVERVIEFAIVNFIAYQEGVTQLIMSGEQGGGPREAEAEPRPVADEPHAPEGAEGEGA